MGHTDFPGGKIHYRETGSGPLAVFIHGFPLDSSMWLDQLAGLGHLRRCVAVDLAGSGRSDPVGDAALTMERHAASVAAVIEDLGNEPVDVVALSMGGYIALAMWEMHHPLVRSLVLADTRSGADSEEGRAKREMMAIKTVVQGRQQLSHDMVEALLAPQATLQAKARLRSMVESTSYETIVASLEGMKQRPDRTPILATITVPTTIVVGADDTVTPPSEAEAMAASVVGAHLEIVPEAGHMTPIERPQAFNRVLAEHFARVDSAAAQS